MWIILKLIRFKEGLDSVEHLSNQMILLLDLTFPMRCILQLQNKS